MVSRKGACRGKWLRNGRDFPPSRADGRASVTVELPVKDCPAPRDASSRYYARVNVSAESAFALTEAMKSLATL